MRSVTLKKYLLAGLIFTASSNVLAWGDFERGIATGVAGAWIYDRFTKSTQPMPVYPTGVQPQRYMQPGMSSSAAPTTWLHRYPECRTDYLYNSAGVVVATQSICN